MEARAQSWGQANEVSVVVPAGGTATRFGSDKLLALLGERTVLETTLAGLPAGWPVFCVGEERPLSDRAATWVREEPPHSGPAAGLAAALPHVTTPFVAVLAGDTPFGGAALPRLADELFRQTHADGCLAADPSGRIQPLVAVYRREALSARVRGMTTVANVSMKHLLQPLTLSTLTVNSATTHDVDTPRDLAVARDADRPSP